MREDPYPGTVPHPVTVWGSPWKLGGAVRQHGQLASQWDPQQLGPSGTEGGAAVDLCLLSGTGSVIQQGQGANSSLPSVVRRTYGATDSDF